MVPSRYVESPQAFNICAYVPLLCHPGSFTSCIQPGWLQVFHTSIGGPVQYLRIVIAGFLCHGKGGEIIKNSCAWGNQHSNAILLLYDPYFPDASVLLRLVAITLQSNTVVNKNICCLQWWQSSADLLLLLNMCKQHIALPTIGHGATQVRVITVKQ